MNKVEIVITDLKCKICGKKCESEARLGSHIGGHGIKFEDYIAEHFLLNGRPKCPVCGEQTRYQRGKNKHFKKYCKKHANQARKEWSAKNGFGRKIDARWRLGKTKEVCNIAKKQSERTKGKNNPNTLTEEKFIEHLEVISQNGFNVLESYDDYVANHYRLKTMCQKCNHIQTKHSLNTMQKQIKLGNPIRCNKCNPFGQSIPEVEVYEFVKSITKEKLERNYRGLGKELDIYIPSRKFAIEYNGLYWHSSEKKSAHYHEEKSNICKESEIRLMHIFSDEWRDKKEIVKSMIRYKLGLSSRIFARKTEVKEVNKNIYKDFFSDNHLDGNANAFKCWALYHNNKPVAMLSIRMPKNKFKGRAIEIARYANKTNTVVVGGFSKLLKQVKGYCKKNNYDTIFTFADYRFSWGQTYSNQGFSLERFTPPSYWISDGIKRIDRYSTKAILQYKGVDSLKEAGLFKVYNCGNWLFRLDL